MQNLIFFSGLTVLVLLAGVVWALSMLRQSRRETAAARADTNAARTALTRQKRETGAETQSLEAANSLLASASGRFQELFQGMPAACVCFDRDGRIMEWNRAFEHLYDRPVACGESIWKTVYASAEDTPDDSRSTLPRDPAVAGAVAAALEGKRQEGLERRIRRADGSVRHLYCSIFPLRGMSGEITGAISADIDISAQQEAEDALRRSEERLHTLYNVTSRPELSFEEKTEELLTFGAAQFGLEIGILAEVRGETYRIVQAVSLDDQVLAVTEYAVCDVYCAKPLQAADAVSLEEVGATDLRYSAAYQHFKMEAYLGAPVRVNGSVWGTLCFAGAQPHPRLFTSGDRELLRLMAQWIGGEIARRQAEEAIKESEERFRTAIASISEGLIVVDAGGVVTLWNSSAERILGMTRTEIHGLRPVNPEFEAVREDGTKFPQGSYPLLASLRRGVAQQNVVMGLPRQRLDGEMLPGEMLWVSVNAKPLCLPGTAEPYAVVATFADITDQRRSADQITRQMVQITDYAAVLEQQKRQLEDANLQLEMLAMNDTLTGLGNRRAFDQRIVQEMNQARRYGTPLSVLLLDVDLFKSYNDTFGHPAGDEVLRLLAAALQSQGRDTDFFARYGGEEFIVVLPQTDAAGAMVLAERLRVAVERTNWPLCAVTASIGASTLTAAMENETALVSAADRALYAAKSAGRNGTFHALSLPLLSLPLSAHSVPLATGAENILPLLAAA